MSFNTERRGSNACVALPTNLPNCRDEFERIHQERKKSRELTIKELENQRLQRSASVDVYGREFRKNSLGFTPKLSNGRVPNGDQNQNGDARKEDGLGVSTLRYTGVHIPSRSFRALASLMGMDPDTTNADQVDIKPSSTGKH